VNVRVSVRARVGGVVVNSVSPATINVTVETVMTKKDVPVEILVGPLPPDADADTPVVVPSTVTVRGARTLIDRVDRVTATITVEPSALDIDRMIEPVPVDASGVQVPSITVEPRAVRVRLTVINDSESKSAVPIAAVFAGTPAPGYHVTGVTFDPPNVALVGDADNLAGVLAVDTQPIDIGGASGDLSRVVTLALPEGLTAPGVDRITATVSIELQTDNRTFNAGIELIGRDPALSYEVPTDPVTVALFGSILDLDRIGQQPLLVQLDVSGLGPGTHTVAVRPVVPAALTVSASSPGSVTVTIAAAATSAAPGSSTP
jgi:YbbR domain-containing protein